MANFQSVVQVDGVWVVKKTYPGGKNVSGNKTGMLWHDAEQMTLQQRIEEGIYKVVNVPSPLDQIYSNYIGIEIVYEHTLAEIHYVEVYELKPLPEIKTLLKEYLTYAETYSTLGLSFQYNNKTFNYTKTLEGTLNVYSSVLALGGTLPANASIHSVSGEVVVVDSIVLKDILDIIATIFDGFAKQFVSVSSAIDSSTTYEQARLAAVWNGNQI